MLCNRVRRFRRGFTLVELMVAAALSITIMWILAESFKMGIDFARSARSTGDMMTQLNNAGQIMLRDLQAPHFQYVPNVSTGNVNGQLSLVRPDMIGSSGTAAAYTGYTPPNGYFQIVSPPPVSSIPDDSGAFQITTTTGASLAFTSFLPQGLPQNLFTTVANGTPYYSRAAEMAYFLGSPAGAGQPTGTTQPLIATIDLNKEQPQLITAGQPLYNLYRRQRLVAVNTDYAPQLQPIITTGNAQYDANAADVISYTTITGVGPRVNVLTDSSSQPGVTYAANQYPSISVATPLASALLPQVIPSRFGTTVPLAPLTTAGRVGDDILLSNVLSFEVLAIWNPSTTIMQPTTPASAIPAPRPYTVSSSQGNANYASYVSTSVPCNSNYPFDNFGQAFVTAPMQSFNSAHPYTFDTWYKYSSALKPTTNWNNFNSAPTNTNLLPMPIQVTALQITVRVYDPRTKQARQSTWRIPM